MQRGVTDIFQINHVSKEREEEKMTSWRRRGGRGNTFNPFRKKKKETLRFEPEKSQPYASPLKKRKRKITVEIRVIRKGEIFSSKGRIPSA